MRRWVHYLNSNRPCLTCVHSGLYDANKVDVWSLGATAWEMAETDPPFMDVEDPHRVPDIWPPLSQPEKYSQSFHEFLSFCSSPASTRPSAHELLTASTTGWNHFPRVVNHFIRRLRSFKGDAGVLLYRQFWLNAKTLKIAFIADKVLTLKGLYHSTVNTHDLSLIIRHVIIQLLASITALLFCPLLLLWRPGVCGILGRHRRCCLQSTPWRMWQFLSRKLLWIGCISMRTTPPTQSTNRLVSDPAFPSSRRYKLRNKGESLHLPISHVV